MISRKEILVLTQPYFSHHNLYFNGYISFGPRRAAPH